MEEKHCFSRCKTYNFPKLKIWVLRSKCWMPNRIEESTAGYIEVKLQRINEQKNLKGYCRE